MLLLSKLGQRERGRKVLGRGAGVGRVGEGINAGGEGVQTGVDLPWLAGERGVGRRSSIQRHSTESI